MNRQVVNPDLIAAAQIGGQIARAAYDSGLPQIGAAAFKNYWRGNKTRVMKRVGNFTSSGSNKRRKYYNTTIPSSYVLKNVRTGGLVGQEVKFVDCWGETVDPTPTALPELIDAEKSGLSVQHLTAVSQGAGESERIGRNIFVKSLQITFFAEVQEGYESAGLAAINEVEVTFFVVLDKQCNATSPTASAIWNQPVASIALGGHPMRNLEYKDRFKILATRRVILNADTSGTGSHVVIKGDHEYTNYFKKWKKPWKQQYDTTGATISSVTNESITVWAHVTNTPYVRTTGTAFSLGFQARARYTS